MVSEYPDSYCPDCGSLMVEMRRDGYVYFACSNKELCGREVWAIILHRPSVHLQRPTTARY